MTQDIKKKTVSGTVLIGVYAMYFMISGAGATTPGIAAMGVAFPDIPQSTITMINTLPSLTIILGTLLMGAIAGKKIAYKPAAILSLIIYIVFGIMPTFMFGSASFYAILVTRVCCGYGMGLVAPLGAAVITNLFTDKDQRSKYLGRGGAWQQLGCVVLTMVGGWLAAVDVKYCFLAYLCGLVCLIVVLFCYKDTPQTQLHVDEATNAPKEKTHISGLAWVFIIIMALAQMFCSPTMMNFSNLMATQIPGQDATTVAGIAGTLLSVFVLAGALGSALLNKFIKTFGRFNGLVQFLICAIGMFVIAGAHSVAMFTVGICIFGFGWCTAIPTGNLECANLTNKAGLALVASLLWAIMNVGNFFSSYWLAFIYSIVGQNFAMPLYIGAVLFIILGVIWALVNLGNKAWKKGAKDSQSDE